MKNNMVYSRVMEYLPLVKTVLTILFGVYLINRVFPKFLATLGFAKSTSEKEIQRQIEIKANLQAVSNGGQTAFTVDKISTDTILLGESLNINNSWVDWLNPLNWVEDESRVLAILQDYDRVNFVVLSASYSSKYNRVFVEDLVKYLSASQVEKVMGLWS